MQMRNKQYAVSGNHVGSATTRASPLYACAASCDTSSPYSTSPYVIFTPLLDMLVTVLPAVSVTLMSPLLLAMYAGASTVDVIGVLLYTGIVCFVSTMIQPPYRSMKSVTTGTTIAVANVDAYT